MANATLGTIIHATLKTSDLLEAFSDELARLDDAGAYSDLVGEARRYLPAGEYGYDDPEEAQWVLEDLMDTLTDLAPPYCYFGANPSDGSDFGFWPDFDAIGMAQADGELVQISDPSELDNLDVSEAVHVNDHGNVTLYVRDGWRIAWDVV